MHYADDSIEVNATPEQTWQVLSDLRRLPDWYVPARRIQVLTPGQVRVGWQFLLAVRTLVGLELNATGIITEFNPDSRNITWRGQAPGISGDSRWTVTPAAGSQTRINHSFQGQGWLMFLSQKLGRNRMTVRKRLVNLKNLVEAEV